MKRILESKQAYCVKLAALPFEEKIKLLEKLRQRTFAILTSNTNEAEVVCKALRVLENQEFNESPELEAAILEGVRSPHQAYDGSTLVRIRQSAHA